jgi:hypothetical protein
VQREPADNEPRGAPAAADQHHWYGKWWVWTLVGAAVAGGAVAAYALSSDSGSGGVSPGSLGLLDARR